jgi:ATP-dependent HslUV protease ATP-binding subunit HslU
LARRLHTLLEKLLEEISFSAPDMVKEGKSEILIDAAYVDERLKEIAKNRDLSQFIL